MKIYCDNAAMQPLHPEVKRVIRDFLDADIRNPSAIYADGRKTKTLLEAARARVAKVIGADPDEIFFTSGSTEALNWYLHENDTHSCCLAIDHKAAIRNVHEVLPVDYEGLLIQSALPHDSKVIVGWVNNEIGTIQPVKEIVEACHKRRDSILLDATQAIGHLPINVHELGCDFLCGSFGKLGGLTGSGFLYAKKTTYLSPMLRGGGQERGLRGGTENLIGIVAGAKAIELATQAIDIKTAHMTMIRNNIISELLQIPKSHLNGDLDNRVCGNINMAFEGIEAESLVLQLDLKSVQVSAGSACNSASIEPSHVLKAIGLSHELARASIRITIDENITDEQIDYMVNTIKDCVAKMRQSSPLWKEITNEDN